MMDCRNFKEQLDSYLSRELPGEAAFSLERHAEGCADCRAEMRSRVNLRATMRAAFQSVTLSDEAANRMRTRLREAALADTTRAARRASGPSAFQRFFSQVFAMPLPLTVAAGILIVVGLAYTFSVFGPTVAYASELSPTFIAQAAGDHDYCAVQFARRTEPVNDVDNAQNYDANKTFLKLHEAAASYAQGLTLHAAHVCGFGGRDFAHLVYTRGDGQMISLLVGRRDAQAIKGGRVPSDDGLRAGLQSALHNQYTVSAYQTSRNIVLIVSQLSGAENDALAARLAQPVSAHVRQIEAGQAAANHTTLR